MGHLAVLLAASLGGLSAIVVFVVITICWRRWQRARHPKMVRRPRKRLVPPPVPKLDVRTASVTQPDGSHVAAAGYVEGDIEKRSKAIKRTSPRQPPPLQLSTSVQQLPRRPDRERARSEAQLVVSPPPLPILPPRGKERGTAGGNLTGLDAPVYPGASPSSAPAPPTEQWSPIQLTSPMSSSPRRQHRRLFGSSVDSGSFDGDLLLTPNGGKRAVRFTQFIAVEGSGAEDLSKALPRFAEPLPGPASSPEEVSDESAAMSSRVRGHLKFRLEYRYDTRCLRFQPLRAKGIRERHMFAGTPGIFLKVALVRANELPADGKLSLSKFGNQWRSQTHAREANPTFNAEELNDFPCTVGRLPAMGLLVLVYEHDKLSRSALIGHIWMPLEHVNVTGAHAFWRPIDKGSRVIANEGALHHGNIQFSLMYNTGADRLTVVVLKATGLTVDRTEYVSNIDPYVTVSLLRHGRRVVRKDTPVQRSTAEPVFNASVRFDAATTSSSSPGASVAGGDIADDCCVLISVRDRTRLRADTVIGAVIVGSLATEASGRDHWHDMLRAPGTAVARWHHLGSKPSRRTLTATQSVSPAMGDEEGLDLS